MFPLSRLETVYVVARWVKRLHFSNTYTEPRRSNMLSLSIHYYLTTAEHTSQRCGCTNAAEVGLTSGTLQPRNDESHSSFLFLVAESGAAEAT